MAGRLIRLGDATSQWFNVLLFNGDPNHSISGDAYRFNRRRLMRFIDWLAKTPRNQGKSGQRARLAQTLKKMK